MTALALALLALAVVLAVSGATKLPARQETEDAFEALRIPLIPRRLGAAVLPWAEIALAVGLLVLRGPLLVVAAVAALLLCVVYTIVIARALRFTEPVTCSCFGRFGAARVSTLTLARNVALTLLAAVAVAAAASGVHVCALVTEAWPWVAVAALVAVVFSLVAAGSGTPAATFSHVGDVLGDDEVEADYVRLPIPYGVLESPEGERVLIRDLARTQARLLVFLSSGCGACRRTEENLDAWAAELAPAVGVVPAYTYEPADRSSELPWYLQPEGNVSAVLESPGTPTAVLLGADGLLAGGPVSGEDSIRRFVEGVIDQLREAEAVPVEAGSEA